MKKFLRWTGIVAAGLVVVIFAGIGWLYFASEREIHRRYEVVAVTPPALPSDPAEIAEGLRVAQLAGCLHCHGEKLTGSVVDDIPHLVRLVAPNLSTLLPGYSDAQIATVLRKGVKPDGTSVVFMPSEMFRHLSDQDLARVIAWLRTVPASTEGVQEKTEVRLLGRLIVANGDVKLAAQSIASLPPPVGAFDAADPVSHGRYLVMNLCTECHGQDLEGFAPIHAPALAVAKAYSAAQFARLMHDGVALGDRQLELMSATSRARFAHLRDEELQAVYAFLQSLGDS
ncbi:MAG TPA: c-type cytochrome [Steroidobacteraceae bacterium]